MDPLSSYALIIDLSVIVILSYVFNLISKRTGIPAVLMLILLGIVVNVGLTVFVPGGKTLASKLNSSLEILGIIGLIMIVLEAALDLKLTREKLPVILRSLLVAFICLVGTTLGIALLLELFMVPDFFSAIVYAIPLSILSSAIVIPSVAHLEEKKREFLVYESTLSDILGIMAFYLVLENAHAATAGMVVKDVSINIFLTIFLAILVSYLLVFLFQRITSDIKLFLLIAVLTLLYSVGKLFHLSSLFVILVFGLLLNNNKLFFRGPLKRFMDHKILDIILKDFHLVTAETAFVVRTFFFLIFGMTITIASLFSLEVALLSAAIILVMYGVRFIVLYFTDRQNIFPDLFIAPRGLITILLFFAIPQEYQSPNFDPGVLFFCIIATSIVMSIGLISVRKRKLREEQAAEISESPEVIGQANSAEERI